MSDSGKRGAPSTIDMLGGTHRRGRFYFCVAPGDTLVALAEPLRTEPREKSSVGSSARRSVCQGGARDASASLVVA